MKHNDDKVGQLIEAVQGGLIERALKFSRDVDWTSVSKQALKPPQKDETEEQCRERLDALTSVSMSAELLDYLGELSESKLRLVGGDDAAKVRLNSLVEEKSPPPSSIEERRVLKRWVWVLLQVATSHYRAMELDRAMMLLQLCESAVVKFIQIVPTYPCYGTLSRLDYAIGLVHRESFDYASAKHRFVRSIEFAWQSLRQKCDSGSDRRFRPSFWTDLAISRALGIGLGFVYHAEGQADLALPLLLSAKNLLVRLDEQRISTYVDLIYFDAQRSAYGGDAAVVNDSIKGLEKCRETFSKLDHRLYRARADYSLALAFAQRARQDESMPLAFRGEEDLKKAEHYAEELAEYGRDTGDCRAQLSAKLCMSRIERKRNHLLDAEQLATEAIEASGTHSHLRVGALIARAEAFFRQEKIEEAIIDFEDARGRAGPNLRARAIALLRLTELHARSNRLRPASQYFEEWTKISPAISNAYIRRLERLALMAMESVSSDFIVRMSEEKLNPKALEIKLRGFLVEWAYARTKRQGDNKAANELGISRQTLLNWRTAASSGE